MPVKKRRARRRGRRKKQMKIVLWFKKLNVPQRAMVIASAVLLCLSLAIVTYMIVIYNKLNTEKINPNKIIVNERDDNTGEGYTNFALFGGDSREGNVSKDLNTDCIIVASLNNKTKEVKLVSVYRDTLMDLSNGSIRKCNAAYSNGGPTMAINMLNMNLDLDIQRYVTVDFGAVVDLVDMLGGLDIELTEKEKDSVNHYAVETASVTGNEYHPLRASGLQHLDGVQATTYARIRKGVGDDYARTERQRLLIQKVAEKAVQAGFVKINQIIDKIFPRIATNISLTDILSYAKSFAKYKITETTGFPFEKGSGKIPNKGDCVYPVTLESNVIELHKFLFGAENYNTSDKVSSISKEIAAIVGNRPANLPSETGTGNSGTGGGNSGTGGGNGGGTEVECDHSKWKYSSDGETHVKKCENCGQQIGERERHQFEETIIQEPTETEPGLKKVRCTVCGYDEEVAIPPTGSTKPDPGGETDPDNGTGQNGTPYPGGTTGGSGGSDSGT